MSSIRTTVVKFGAALVLGSAGLMGFLHNWEDGPKSQNVVYADKLARGLPTACRGITKHTSPVPVIVGEVWSEKKCNDVAQMVVEKTQLTLVDCIEVEVSQHTFDALASHAHNVGVANTCASRALALINDGKLEEGCEALAHSPSRTPVWSYVTLPDGTKELVPGLYKRRLAERDYCKTPDPEPPKRS